MDVKLKGINKDVFKDFRLIRKFTIGEEDFNQFMQLRTQLAIAAEKNGRKENLSPVLTLTKSKDMDDQLKLAHRVVDVVDCPNKKICVTLVLYCVDKLESLYTHVRFFARKKEDEKFQKFVYVVYKVKNLSIFLMQ